MQRMAGNHFFHLNSLKLLSFKQAGVSLLEILISLLLLSLGLLAFLRLQLLAIQLTDQALLQAIAATQLRSMADILLIRHTDTTTPINQWNRENEQLLPGAKGSINESGIHISWTDTVTKKAMHLSMKIKRN